MRRLVLAFLLLLISTSSYARPTNLTFERKCDTISQNIQRELWLPINASEKLVKDVALLSFLMQGEKDLRAVKARLSYYQNRVKGDTSYLISDKTKRYYHPNGVERVISETDPNEEWYVTAKNTIAPYDLIISEDEMNENSITYFVNHKVMSPSGQIMGIGGIGLSSEQILRTLDHLSQKYKNNIYVLNYRGKMILHNHSVDQTGFLTDRKIFDKFVTRILNQQKFSSRTNTHLICSHFIEEFNWFILIIERF